MAPNYTTASTSPNIVNGVIFDFGNKVISVPATISFIDSQWVIDHCRLAEESYVGLSRPPIVFGSGKITIDIDVNNNPVKTGVVAILNGWKISTQKTSGSFTIKDVYESDNSIPYLEPAPVPVRYQQTIGGTITTQTTGGTNLTPAQIWDYSSRTLTSSTSGGATLSEIEASTVLAKKTDVNSIPAAVELQLLDNLAAIANTIAAIPTNVWSSGNRTLTQTFSTLTLMEIENSTVLAKQTSIDNLQSFIAPKLNALWTVNGLNPSNPISAMAPTATVPGWIRSHNNSVVQIHRQNPDNSYTLEASVSG